MNAVSMMSYSGTQLGELTLWVEQQRSARATRFVLRSKSEDLGEGYAKEFHVLETESSGVLAEKIHRRAEDEAKHFRGRTLYMVMAFSGQAYLDRTFLTIDSAADDPNLGMREANLSTVTLQLMKHNEANARLAIGSVADVINHYKTQLEKRDQRVAELERKQQEVAEKAEELRGLQHERNVQMLGVAQSGKERDFVMALLAQASPLVFARLAAFGLGPGGTGAMPTGAAPANAAQGSSGAMPGPANPASTSQGSVMAPPSGQVEMSLDGRIDNFCRSLDPQQLAEINKLLRPEQQADILAIYLAYCRRDPACAQAYVQAQAQQNQPGQGGSVAAA